VKVMLLIIALNGNQFMMGGLTSLQECKREASRLLESVGNPDVARVECLVVKQGGSPTIKDRFVRD